MLFKHNTVRRHRIPGAQYRVTNWPAYEAGPRHHSDLTPWLDEVELAGWAALKRSSPGEQPVNQRRRGTQEYSNFSTQSGADQRRNVLVTYIVDVAYADRQAQQAA